MKTNKEEVLSAFIWKFIERIGNKGTQFIIQIILARFLFPSDFGTIAILMVFISLSNVFIQSGFNMALIQKKDADELDFSSALYASLVLAGIFYITIYFASPIIAEFYQEERLIPMLRVLSIILFFGAIVSIQYAYISRTLQFKYYSLSCLISNFLAGAIGIFLACYNFGVWSLVIQQICAIIFTFIILEIYLKWIPRLKLSFSRIKILFKFGWKLLISSLINTAYIDIFNLIVGKIYSKDALGIYNRGNQYPNLIAVNLNETIQSVMLPVLSKVQDDREDMRNLMRRGMITSFFVVSPIMFGLMAAAKPLVLITITDKWLQAVPFLQLCCLLYLLYPIHTANIQTLNAMGRSDLFLKLELIKKAIDIGILCITIQWGLKAMIIGQIIASVLDFYINSRPCSKMLGYGFLQQLKDIMPTLLTSIGMFICVYLIGLRLDNIIQKLFVQIFSGILIYIAMNFILKNESLFFLLRISKEMMKRE